jgi:ribonuclease-3
VQARVQTANGGQPANRLRYVDIAQSGPPHQRVFAVEARLGNDDSEMVLAAAEGSSKKEAQQRAAELALANWDSDGDEAKTRGMQ